MIRFSPEFAVLMDSKLRGIICTLRQQIPERGGEVLIDGDLAKTWSGIVKPLRLHADFFTLRRTKERLARSAYQGDFTDWDIRDMLTEAQEVELGLITDLKEHCFLYVPNEFAPYFHHGNLFGVAGKFPMADTEIFLAGNCYATGQFTACVFHLMRAVEVCAKNMVRAVGAHQYLFSGKNQNNQPILKPIELCDWGTLIKGLERAVSELEKHSGMDVKKKERLIFYSHAIASFRNFKDAWRNKVSHSKKTYDVHETRAIMNNTRDFMTHLAKRLGSSKNI